MLTPIKYTDPELPKVLFSYIILSTMSISFIAWIGALSYLLKSSMVEKILPFLISFAAGTLMGGAFLHLLMESLIENGIEIDIFIWLLIGFSFFFLIEQFLNWHHHHIPLESKKKPVTYMILVADGLHNFIGGLAIGGSFLIDIRAGLTTAIIEAIHEIPQELGDFGILLNGGWKKQKALVANFLSALAIIPGGILGLYSSESFNTELLLPFAGGNFLYIAACDLIPEIKGSQYLLKNLLLFTAFISGVFFILVLRMLG